MRCMIISQWPTFHARLAVKGPNIYLSDQPGVFTGELFWKEAICAAGVIQASKTAKCKTLLISISLSLFVSYSSTTEGGSDDVSATWHTVRWKRELSKTRLLTSVLPTRSSPVRGQDAVLKVGWGGWMGNGPELLAATLQILLWDGLKGARWVWRRAALCGGRGRFAGGPAGFEWTWPSFRAFHRWKFFFN